MTLPTLIVPPFGGLGGSERWLLSLLDATDRLDPAAILLADGPLREELEQRAVPVRVRPTGRRGRDVARTGAWLWSILRRERPSVVLVNGVKAAAAALPPARLLRIPSVWAKHDHSFDRRLGRPLGMLATQVVANSPEVAEPTGRKDAVIIPPPRPARAPVPRDHARQFWRRHGVQLDGRPTLVMVTRLVPFKGVDDAISALTRPAARGWRLVVVGQDDPAEPEERARLARLAEASGLSDRVELADSVPEAAPWLSAFDALAVLTRQEGPYGKEGFGMTALEGMLAGLPIVAVGGGAIEARLQGRGGMMVPSRDPDAVARALAALSAPELRRAKGREALRLVEDHPDAAACAARLVDVLEDAAVQGRNRG